MPLYCSCRRRAHAKQPAVSHGVAGCRCQSLSQGGTIPGRRSADDSVKRKRWINLCALGTFAVAVNPARQLGCANVNSDILPSARRKHFQSVS